LLQPADDPFRDTAIGELGQLQIETALAPLFAVQQ
jgi:hypothetical protein